MVAPLLAVLGYGAQMYGANEQADAQEVVDYRGGVNNRTIMGGMEADQRLTNQILGSLGQQWQGSNATAVDDLSAANLRGSFAGAAGDLGTQIAGVQGQPGAIDPMVQASADNIAFTRHLAGQSASNQERTQALNEVLKNNAGLDAKNRTVQAGMADKSDRDAMIMQRISDIQRLQNYANGVRNAALQRTGSRHALDSAAAASTGSGAMYLGALLQSGAVLANRPGQPGAPGAGAPNVPGTTGQDPYAPWLDPNDPSGMNPYAGNL